MRPDRGEYAPGQLAPARWALWRLPARLVAFVLLIDLTALVLVLADLPGLALTVSDLVTAAVLVGLGLLHTETVLGVQRIRRLAPDAHPGVLAVWTFAGAVLLPLALAATVAAVVLGHLWWRAGRPGVPAYRYLFGTAVVVLCCLATSAVVDAIGGPAHSGTGTGLIGAPYVLIVAIVAYALVNTVLTATAVAVRHSVDTSATPLDAGRLLGHWDDNVLGLVSLCLGALTAVALSANPWLVLLVLPLLVAVQRAVEVRTLETAATTDCKTGLLNATAWQARAARELRRSARSRGGFGLLILDLDHFKTVNDEHGHLAGDDVLSAVAAAIRAEVREHDLVGRFGGEEFVVLLPGLSRESTDSAGLHMVADRIRRRIAALTVLVARPTGMVRISGLSASVGGASYPADGPTLQDVILAADAALYAAKHDGRNLVRLTSEPAIGADSRIAGPPGLHTRWTSIPPQAGQPVAAARLSRRRW